MKKLFGFGLVFLFVFLSFVNVKAAVVYTVPTTYEQKIFEMRGAWVSTVYNIDIPQQIGTTSASILAYQNEYLRILDTFEEYNMNTVFFQARPCNDAFYQSSINSWSVYMAGQDGLYPGWDPFAWMIEQTHARGMEFHAWLNPYRAAMSILEGLDPSNYDTVITAYLNSLGENNFAKNNPDLLVIGGNRLLLNPGEPAVRAHLVDTIEEIVTNYDVDAIHFDDYFYTSVDLSEDYDTYLEYKSGTITQEDWRRLQVDLLVEEISDSISLHNVTNQKSVEFGISPMSSISDTYSGQYADVENWITNEWIDYVVPQMYQALGGSYHKPRTATWIDAVDGTDVKIYMGLASYNYSTNEGGWTNTNELIDVLRYQAQFPSVKGIFFFSAKNFVLPENLYMKEAVEKVKTYWTHKTLSFDFEDVSSYDLIVPSLSVVRENKQASISFNKVDGALGYAIYAFEEGKTKTYNNSNIAQVIENDQTSYEVSIDTLSYKDYTFGIKIIYKDGELSSGYEEVFSEKISGNIAPVISDVSFSVGRNYFEFAELVNIVGTVSDENEDLVDVSISISTNGINYSYNFSATVVDNQFSYAWRVPSLKTSIGKIKITATDGLLESEYIIERIVIKDYITEVIVTLDRIQLNYQELFREMLR
ncbi:MAG: family 10 glycosylhydrolase [Bacilli bacterium]|nr:family 10 glycosylhydrolase [Bacilli bacterium]